MKHLNSMPEPTREQVLEWLAQTAAALGIEHNPEDWDDLEDEEDRMIMRLCALAYAAGKAEGAREENEACEKLCLTPFPESGTPHSLAFDSPEECADAIRKRRPV